MNPNFGFLIIFIYTLIIYNFYSKYFSDQIKYNKIKYLFIMISLFFVTRISMQQIIIFNAVIAINFILLIYSLIFIKGEMVTKVFYNLLIIQFMISTTNISTMFLKLIYYYEYSIGEISEIFSGILMVLLNVCLYIFLSKILKSKKLKLDIFSYKQQYFLCVISLITIYLELYKCRYNIIDNNLFSIIDNLLPIFSILFLLFVLYNNYIKQLKNIEIEKIVTDSQLDKALEIKNHNDNINKLKHDMKHILGYINMSIENNDLIQAKSVIDNYLIDINKVKNIHITNNSIINYAINSLSTACDKNNVDFSCIINCDFEFKVSDNDLLILLSNLFDNAIENYKGKKNIKLEINDKNDCIIICISNTIDEDNIDINKLNKSSKMDNNHGYGIKSINYIIEKYNGKIKFESDDYLMTAKVIFKK